MNVNDKKGRLITLRNALTGEEVEIISTVTQADLKLKQDIVDESLITTEKEIVPAINEVYNQIINLDNKLNDVPYKYDKDLNSFSIGVNTAANGLWSYAEGYNTIASGVASHSEGAKYENNRNTESVGQASHAEGASTYAKADGSHAEGILNVAGRFLDEVSTAAQELGTSGTQQELVAKLLGYGAHAEGMNNEALGSCSHAEGSTTKALANSTHSEGDSTIAFGEAAHAEGYNTQATGNQSHAEGNGTIASGNSSHAEGIASIASGTYSHAEGSHTESEGRDSHAEGAYNKAIGIASHAEGVGNYAMNQGQHVGGKYATIDNSGTMVFQIGIGDDENNRKDGFVVYTDGSCSFNGTTMSPNQWEALKTVLPDIENVSHSIDLIENNITTLQKQIEYLDPSTSLFADYGPHQNTTIDEVIENLSNTNNISIGKLIAILDADETLTEYQCTKTYDYTSIRFFDENNGWVICESNTGESGDYEKWYSNDLDRTFYVHKEAKTVSVLAGDGETFILASNFYTHPFTWTAVERYKLEVQTVPK